MCVEDGELKRMFGPHFLSVQGRRWVVYTLDFTENCLFHDLVQHSFCEGCCMECDPYILTYRSTTSHSSSCAHDSFNCEICSCILSFITRRTYHKSRESDHSNIQWLLHDPASTSFFRRHRRYSFAKTVEGTAIRFPLHIATTTSS